MSDEVNLNKIAAETIASLIEDNVGKFCAKVKQVVGDELDRTKVDFNFAFTTYLKNAAEKYSYIKTLLFRDTPKYIYDFYECNHIKNGKKIVDVSDINNLLNMTHFSIITGTGGIGKSTMLKHFFLSTIKDTNLIPLLIELKDLNNTSDSLLDCIYSSLTKLGFSLPKKALVYALQTGSFCLLLDGYDEISDERQIVKEIDALCDQYSDNYFIITSRPSDTFISWQRFFHFKAQSFSKEQAISLISKVEYDPETKSLFLAELEKRLYEKHRSFASNPLLLTIMLLTFENCAEIPDKLHIFYGNAFEALLVRHDATKGPYKRRLKCGLSNEDFTKFITEFCFKSYVKGMLSFNKTEINDIFRTIKIIEDKDFDLVLSDVIVNVCILYLDGLQYRFTHRSFQEYFTALYIRDLYDEQYIKVSTALINKDPTVLRFDSVFLMLFEMNKVRFEKNLIIPFLNGIKESLILDKNPCKYLFDMLYSAVSINYKIDDKTIPPIYQIGFTVKNEFNSGFLSFIQNRYNYLIKRQNLKAWEKALTNYALEKHRNNYNLDGSRYNINLDTLEIDSDPQLKDLIFSENGYLNYKVQALNTVLNEIQSNHALSITDIENLFQD